jgi:hypothetical protein
LSPSRSRLAGYIAIVVLALPVASINVSADDHNVSDALASIGTYRASVDDLLTSHLGYPENPIDVSWVMSLTDGQLPLHVDGPSRGTFAYLGTYYGPVKANLVADVRLGYGLGLFVDIVSNEGDIIHLRITNNSSPQDSQSLAGVREFVQTHTRSNLRYLAVQGGPTDGPQAAPANATYQIRISVDNMTGDTTTNVTTSDASWSYSSHEWNLADLSNGPRTLPRVWFITVGIVADWSDRAPPSLASSDAIVTSLDIESGGQTQNPGRDELSWQGSPPGDPWSSQQPTAWTGPPQTLDEANAHPIPPTPASDGSSNPIQAQDLTRASSRNATGRDCQGQPFDPDPCNLDPAWRASKAVWNFLGRHCTTTLEQYAECVELVATAGGAVGVPAARKVAAAIKWLKFVDDESNAKTPTQAIATGAGMLVSEGVSHKAEEWTGSPVDRAIAHVVGGWAGSQVQDAVNNLTGAPGH